MLRQVRESPRGHVHSAGVLERPCGFAWCDRTDDEHEDDEEEEGEADEVEVVEMGSEVVGDRAVEVTNGEDYEAGNESDLGCDGWVAFGEQAYNDDGKDGDEVDGVHLLEVAEDAVLALEKACADHGGDGDDPAKNFA